MSGFTTNKSHKDQRGIVSIIVVSILTITLALIAIGFSKLADRELTQASDRELSNQAYYAAQSGISDAIAYLSSPGATSFPGCAPPAAARTYFQPNLANGAEYSCISVNNTPQVLTASGLAPNNPQVLLVSGSNLRDLYISWENAQISKAAATGLNPTYGNLPREDTLAGGETGLLRVGIYRVPAGDHSDTNAGLAAHTAVYYLYPNWSGGSPSAGAITYAENYSLANGPGGSDGSFVHGNCSLTPKTPPSNPQQAATYFCNSEIKGLDPASTYYLYLTSQYATLNVNVTGDDGGSPTPSPVTFSNSQAVIDVTGQGSDVIQRVRAHVNLASPFDVPAYAVQSMETLCKDFTVTLGTSPNQYGAATPLDSANDPACVGPAGTGTISGGIGTKGH